MLIQYKKWNMNQHTQMLIVCCIAVVIEYKIEQYKSVRMEVDSQEGVLGRGKM